MKRIILFSIAILLLLSSCCNYNYKNMAGIYQFKEPNTYHGDKVTLTLNKDKSFNYNYYYSMGGFEFDGKYIIKGNMIILHPRIEKPYLFFSSCDTCMNRKIIVYDQDNEILAYSNIEILKNNKSIYQTYTDTNGVASLPIIGDTLRVSFILFEEYNFTLSNSMSIISVHMVESQYIRKKYDGYTYIINSKDSIIDNIDKDVHVRLVK